MPQPFTVFQGVGVPLRRSNVDTDQIIPAVYMKRISRSGFEDGLFAQLRTDPAFVLNNPSYQAGGVLLAGSDFGTGSSREHAVWALLDYGFRVVISPRFADIFHGNAGKAGLLAAQVTQAHLEELSNAVETSPGLELTVDLRQRTIAAAGCVVPFEIDDDTRWRLLNGLDDIALTLQQEDLIATYERKRSTWFPTTTLPS